MALFGSKGRQQKRKRTSPIQKRKRQPRILTTYETLTPESIEQGDVADRGWIDEEGVDMAPDKWDIEDGITAVDNAIKFLSDGGVTEASSWPTWHSGVWYTAYEYSTNYRTGEVENRSYHLEGFTDDESREIFKAMTKRR